MFLSSFYLTITIGEAHGDADDRMILADNNPLIKNANFSRNLGATVLNRFASGLDLSRVIFFVGIL